MLIPGAADPDLLKHEWWAIDVDGWIVCGKITAYDLPSARLLAVDLPHPDGGVLLTQIIHDRTVRRLTPIDEAMAVKINAKFNEDPLFRMIAGSKNVL